MSDSRYQGNDNYGRPKQQYIDKIALLTPDDLELECYEMIYHSARCGNNGRADWHWMVDACYDECVRRNDVDIYKRAYEQCVADHT